MDAVVQRIKELMDDQGLSHSEFAKRTNLNPAIISHILSGRNKPSLGVITSIKEEFTNVNTDYLLTGKGAIYHDITNVNTEKTEPVEASTSLPSFSTGFPMEGVRVASVPESSASRSVKEDEGPSPASSNSTDSKGSRVQAPVDKGSRHKEDPAKIEQIVIFYADGSFKAYRP